jgi:hypothetical protein
MKKDKLTKKEYEEILKYYKKSIPKDVDKNKIKELAEDLVAQKLCSCIKSVNKEKHKDGEKRSIGICKSSILLKKGFSDRGFHCKNGRPKITLKKYNDKTFGCWRNQTKKNKKNNKTSKKSRK